MENKDEIIKAKELEIYRLECLIEQAHYTISQLIDGARNINIEKSNAWEVKRLLGEVVDKHYGRIK